MGDRRQFELRRVTADEWEPWREVRPRALVDAPHAFESRLAYWQAAGEEAWRSRLTDVPLNVLAVAGDSLLGQASGMAVDADGRVELISMWVDPDARGTGVGEALVADVLAWATTCGAVAVTLAVKETNARAESLYRRMGFTRTDEQAGDANVRMQRSLL